MFYLGTIVEADSGTLFSPVWKGKNYTVYMHGKLCSR